MKTGVSSVFLALLILPACAAEQERSVDEKLVMASLVKLPARMKIKFNIPFPKDWDIDVHRKQPIGIMEVDGGKVCVTQPRMQPYDGTGTVEWMIGPEDPKRLTEENLDCMLDFDDTGEFLSIVLMSDGEDWPADGANHQLSRGEDETGPAFFERAMLTYRLRSKKAKEPVFAARAIATTEMIAMVVQQLRKGEAGRKKE
jgi:hypothetical protein